MANGNRKIKGTGKPVKVELANPGLFNTLDRDGKNITDRLHFLFTLGPATLKSDELPKAERAKVAQAIEAVQTYIDNAAQRFQAVLESANVAIGEGLIAGSVDILITNPLSKQYVACFEKADVLLRLVDTLWIDGFITDDERFKEAATVRKQLNRLAAAAQLAQREVLNAINAKNDDSKSGAETNSAESTNGEEVVA